MWCPEDTMADDSYILFNKTPSQLRLVGARGGRACARNRRLRRPLPLTLPAAIPLRAEPQETTAQAIALLEARFPWLRRGERPRTHPENRGHGNPHTKSV